MVFRLVCQARSSRGIGASQTRVKNLLVASRHPSGLHEFPTLKSSLTPNVKLRTGLRHFCWSQETTANRDRPGQTVSDPTGVRRNPSSRFTGGGDGQVSHVFPGPAMPDDSEPEGSPQPVWLNPPDDVTPGAVPMELIIGNLTWRW